jgi:NAD(P)H dehydrogenase (quinone)
MKVLVVYHSIYGHIQTMAKAVQEGAQEVADAEAILRRVREFPEYVQHIEQKKGAAIRSFSPR